MNLTSSFSGFVVMKSGANESKSEVEEKGQAVNTDKDFQKICYKEYERAEKWDSNYNGTVGHGRVFFSFLRWSSKTCLVQMIQKRGRTDDVDERGDKCRSSALEEGKHGASAPG